MELREAIEEVRKANTRYFSHPSDLAKSVILEAIIDGTLIPADQCYEVREGYRVQAQFLKTIYEDAGVWVDIPLSEALTIRSADAVRREAVQKCITELSEGYLNGDGLPAMVKRMSALIDTPQPKGGDDE